MTGPRQVLDQLDAARENAALGSLRVGEHYGIHLYAGENPVGTTLRAADAALIVAAVNHLPALASALRAVADLADEHRANGEQRALVGKPAWPLDVARDLRAALAPLAAPDTADETAPSPTNEKASDPR